jgi:hypothetical protein
MILQPISQQIQEWKTATDLSDSEQAKLARMEAFQRITNLEIYLRDELEHYRSIQAFTELLKMMGMVCQPHLSIQNMEGTYVKEDPEKGWENEWIFEFDVNGNDAEISLPPPKNVSLLDDFFEDLLTAFNQILKEYDVQSEFRRLNVIGDLLDQPTIEIGLFAPEVLEKMMGKA